MRSDDRRNGINMACHSLCTGFWNRNGADRAEIRGADAERPGVRAPSSVRFPPRWLGRGEGRSSPTGQYDHGFVIIRPQSIWESPFRIQDRT